MEYEWELVYDLSTGAIYMTLIDPKVTTFFIVK